MRFLLALTLLIPLCIYSCGNSDDYININDIVDGNTGGGNPSTNGFTFNDVFYSTTTVAYQGGLSLSFSSNAQTNNGGVIMPLGEDFVEGATIPLGTTTSITITPDMNAPTNFTQHLSTSGTLNVTSLNSQTRTVVLDYTIITNSGSATGQYNGGYIIQ